MFNRKVVPKRFKVGDQVLKRVDLLRNIEKLEPILEGPYIVTKELLRKGHKLNDLREQELDRPCNAKMLKHFYV